MSDEEDKVEEEVEESAEGAEEDGGEEEEDEGGLDTKKIILFFVLPVLLLAGIGGGLYFTGMLDSLLGVEKCEQKVDDHGEPVMDEHGEPVMDCPAEEEHGEEAGGDHGADAAAAGGHGEEGSGGAFLAIPTMIVNLNTEDGTPRYLRLTVQLELKNPAELPQIEAVIPRVIDQFQTYLRELRVKDLRGSAGIYRLQMELLWRVNQASPVEVKDVLFQEILIQ